MTQTRFAYARAHDAGGTDSSYYSYFVTVWLYDHVTVWLYDCMTAVWLFDHVTVWLYVCMTVALHDCVDVLSLSVYQDRYGCLLVIVILNVMIK